MRINLSLGIVDRGLPFDRSFGALNERGDGRFSSFLFMRFLANNDAPVEVKLKLKFGRPYAGSFRSYATNASQTE